MPKFDRFWGIFLVIILSYWAIKPFIITGFFPIHDDTQVARVFEMTKSLKDGMFPVRWVSDLGYGYGYPLFNFYAPFSYYIGSIFNIMGFDSLVSLKIMMAIGIVFAGVSMYFLARKFWGEFGAVLSAVLYTYAPYHAVDIYVRGDVAEFWAYAFIPLTFYAIINIYNSQKFRFVAIGSFVYAGIILSHNLTALVTTPFLLIVILLYSYFAYKQKKFLVICYLLFVIVIGILLSAFYWFPALLEMGYTNVLSQIGGGADYKDHFVCSQQLWDSQWGFGGSIKGCNDGLSFRLGKIHILLMSIVFIYLMFNYKKNINHSVLIVSFIGFFISIFLLLPVSQFVWDKIKIMSFLQYPWRFLILAMFFSSFISGSFSIFVRQVIKFKKMFFLINVGIIFLVILYYVKLFNPQFISPRFVSDYTSDAAIKWIASKISDEYMPKNFRKPIKESEIINQKISILNGNAKIINSKQKTQFIQAEIFSINNSSLLVQTAYFPAWNIYKDGKKSSFTINNIGFEVPINSGRHVITVKFEETIIEKIANSFSLFGLLILFLGIIKKQPLYEKTDS